MRVDAGEILSTGNHNVFLRLFRDISTKTRVGLSHVEADFPMDIPHCHIRVFSLGWPSDFLLQLSKLPKNDKEIQSAFKHRFGQTEFFRSRHERKTFFKKCKVLEKIERKNNENIDFLIGCHTRQDFRKNYSNKWNLIIRQPIVTIRSRCKIVLNYDIQTSEKNK